MQPYRIVAMADKTATKVRDPFYQKESLPLPGPVFIHEHECERYPEDAGFPADMLSHRLTLNAYGSGRWLIAQRYIVGGLAEPDLEELLENREVAYIHVRDTQAGCYDFCIERVKSGETSAAEADGGRINE